ncbi:hypothetical protein PDJAM_G00079430 [Pangasius djambal]|uniref:Uncharacterized protein n=1 Tax=Pangasius djambal TaxID=1691987 RepID=A0ACC5Z2J3_9TELE|nr:hypothetical protein [Pangasius djambal]
MAALVRIASCTRRVSVFSRVAAGLCFRTKLQQPELTVYSVIHHHTARAFFCNLLLQNPAEMSAPFSTSSSSSSSSAETMSQRMVWVDLEMTGLDIEKDEIIEMACIITDSDLNVVAEGPNLIINQPDELLDSMSDWCKEHHGKSGLTQAVRDSKISLQQAERWFPGEYKHAPQKKASHRALDDIQESIKELKFYRANVFKTEGEEKKRKIVENGESKHTA